MHNIIKKILVQQLKIKWNQSMNNPPIHPLNNNNNHINPNKPNLNLQHRQIKNLGIIYPMECRGGIRNKIMRGCRTSKSRL